MTLPHRNSCTADFLPLHLPKPMKRAKQEDFFADDLSRKGRTTHGGGDAKKNTGKRKRERPLDSRKPVHLVLKSRLAREGLSLRAYRNRLVVDRILIENARKFGITVHDKANVGNHLHLVLGLQNR